MWLLQRENETIFHSYGMSSGRMVNGSYSNSRNRIPSSIDLTVDQQESGLVNGLPFSYSDGSRKSLMEFCPGETFRGRGILPCPDCLVEILARFHMLEHFLEYLDHTGLISVCVSKHKAQ
ncbi:hypothetical protein CEXT_157631 [Caerostris extrusa]|uniref:Uncharacterized protein n=1 Tax=Caerostris extrusa TaxID=172846 RepID=A0AAV4W119_CAEEX|nr:hypothetical protein CEXT_157631 [Caerostris extrusa]